MNESILDLQYIMKGFGGIQIIPPEHKVKGSNAVGRTRE